MVIFFMIEENGLQYLDEMFDFNFLRQRYDVVYFLKIFEWFEDDEIYDEN